jgi:hypothetical protein
MKLGQTDGRNYRKEWMDTRRKILVEQSNKIKTQAYGSDGKIITIILVSS